MYHSLFSSHLYQLTDKQFIWTALRARAVLKMWKDVEALFQAKVGIQWDLRIKTTHC